MQMYQRPYPVPIPVPVPVPVPIFIPTTRNSYRGVEKTMKKIRAKMPSDPLEAELLALAGGLGKKKVSLNLELDHVKYWLFGIISEKNSQYRTEHYPD